MKVWQFGSHLSDERGARVDDWTWRQTRRRLGVLARLARPYPGRTALALVTLVAYTGFALLPPYLAGLAVNEGIKPHDLHTLSVIVAAFFAAGVAAFVLSGAQTYFTGWVGERALADEIVVLDHGRIAARGTQSELLEVSPVFREIHEHGLLQQVVAG